MELLARNTNPLEILWAVAFSAAFVNFSLELRQCMKDRRELNDAARTGKITKADEGSSRIQVRRNIITQVYMMLTCALLAALGYYNMTLPDRPIPRENIQPAVVGGGILLLVGLILVAYSFTIRYFTNALRRNLRFRRRIGLEASTPEHARKEGIMGGRLMQYTFKPGPEMLWTLALVILGGVMAYIKAASPEDLANPAVFGPALILVVARPVLGFLFDKLGAGEPH